MAGESISQTEMMKLFRKISVSAYIFAAVVILFCALFTTVEMINGKFWTNDFRVYYDAQHDFLSGNNPYIKNYGLDTGFFKYPPFTLYLFSFFSLVPYWLGQLLHLALLAGSFIISVPLLKALAENTFGNEDRKKRTWILYVAFLATAIHLTREFHLGNINLLLLLLFSLGLRSAFDGKNVPAAIFWALMVVLKPIMILAFVPLIFWRKWKIIGLLACLGTFFFLFPVLHLGWNGNLHLWMSWLRSIAKHGEYIVSENSLTYLAQHYFGIASAWIPSLVVLLVLIAIMLWEIYRSGTNVQRFVCWTIVFTSAVPNFFVTDTEHFLISLPQIIFLLYLLAQKGRMQHWIVFFVGMLLFSFNSNDLLGRNLSDYLDGKGILGIANLLFIVLFLWFGKTKSLNPRH